MSSYFSELEGESAPGIVPGVELGRIIPDPDQ